MSANVQPHAVQPNSGPDNVEPRAVQRYPTCVQHTCAPPEDHSGPDAPPNRSRTPSSGPGPARPPTSMSSNAHCGFSDCAPSPRCEGPPATTPIASRSDVQLPATPLVRGRDPLRPLLGDPSRQNGWRHAFRHLVGSAP